MDKQRNQLKKSLKPKGYMTPSSLDLIPLGQKPKEGDSSRLVQAGKRDLVPAASSGLLAKKIKLGGVPSPLRSDSPSTSKYDEMALECAPGELFDKLIEEPSESEQTDKLLCGAVKHLRQHRTKPDPQICLVLLYIAKVKPALFTTEAVTGTLTSLLKRDVSSNFKTKGNPAVTVLACCLLYAGYAEEDHWPQVFIELYLEDSVGERTWVDRSDCKPFVDNIITAFNTNMKPINNALLESLSLSLPALASGSSPNHSPFASTTSADSDERATTSQFIGSGDVRNRYEYQQDSVEQLVMDTVNDHMNRKQHVEVSNKQLLRLLASVASFCSVRLMVLPKLELWLSNPKLTRVAQDLMMCVCLNSKSQDPNEKEVISGLLKLRLKNKQLMSHYLACLRELLENDDENMRLVMTHTIYNEMSTSRNQNNMSILAVMFQYDADKSAKMLAEIFLDLLMNKEDYLRSLRALLREIVRSLRYDFTFQSFCVGLMVNRSACPLFNSLDSATKERSLLAITDLVTICQFLTISPAVREAATSASWSDKRKDVTSMQSFWTQIAVIQKEAVIWMHNTVMSLFPSTDHQMFIQCLHKLLMMAHAEHYHKIDNWPPEQERQLVLRLVAETPVLEETIKRLLVMGLDNHYPLKASDALDIVYLMITRAAALTSENYPVLEMKSPEIPHMLLLLATYHHPDNIKLPRGYQPPRLAIASMYWKCWSLLLIIGTHNVASTGKYVWDTYPTVRMLMVMVMTGNYSFPPSTSQEEAESIIAQDRQISELEKQEILEFEGHLAAATSNVTISEHNSLLLSQLISMNEVGPARKPTAKVLEDIRSMNATLHLGVTLCKSRNPDFLMNIIQQQGTSNAMSWLSELVESSEGSLEVLPVQCLCEFLLVGSDNSKETSQSVASCSDKQPDRPTDKQKPSQRLMRQEKLLVRLQSIMKSANDGQGTSSAAEVIEYFFQRLASPSTSTRQHALKAMRLILSTKGSDSTPTDRPDEFDWLLYQVPKLYVYPSLEPLISAAVYKALQYEMSPQAVSAYIQFLLSTGSYKQEPSEAILVISRMLNERRNLTQAVFKRIELVLLITKAYHEFMLDAVTRETGYDWPDPEYKVVVYLEEASAILDVRIVHSIIYLLCLTISSDSPEKNALLDLWFPVSGQFPSGSIIETSEVAEFLTDSLRLSMLQTDNKRLIASALEDTTASQLLMFMQSFGLSNVSMTCILEKLDVMCEQDTKGAKRAVQPRKQYLQQLIVVLTQKGLSVGRALWAVIWDGVEPDRPMERPLDHPMPLRDTPTECAPGALRSLCIMECQTTTATGQDILSVMEEGLLQMDNSPSNWLVVQRSLLQRTCTESHVAAALMRTFSSHKSDFLTSICKAGASACSVLRLLALGEFCADSEQLFTSLSQSIGELPAPLAAVVRHAVQKSESEPQTKSIDSEFNLQMVNLCIAGDRERALSICMEKIDQMRQGVSTQSLIGVVIDWLELLDPEIDSLCTDLQDVLLFGHETDVKERINISRTEPMDGPSHCMRNASALAGPSYLRALLAHQARFSTIRSTINRLLTSSQEARWSCSAVLDFISICQNHPRLFQGREQRKSKKAPVENILQLSSEQLCQLAFLICKEVTDSDSEYGTPSPLRVKLLVNCCTEDEHLVSLVRYLEDRCSVTERIYDRLLIMMYSWCPKIIHMLSDQSVLYRDASLALTGSCALDSEANAALTILGSVKAGKKSVLSMSDANLVCRRIAAEHPLLFLRQTHILASLLAGRFHLSFPEFVNQNLLLLYTHVLGLVELLQPHIFRHKDLAAVIDSYFGVLKVHGGEQDETIAAIFVKLITVLCNYFNCLPDQCVKTLIKHKDIISLLQSDNRYNKNPGLKALATASSMPTKQEIEACADNSHAMPFSMPSEMLPFTNEQLAPVIRKLAQDASSEDIIAALSDLDNTSKKKVEVLAKFLDDLKRHMVSSNEKVRDVSFRLAKRYLCHNPRVCSEFLSTLLSSLQSESHEVSKTALSYVVEIGLLMNEDDRKQLLDCAFSVALRLCSDEGLQQVKDTLRIVTTNVYVGKS